MSPSRRHAVIVGASVAGLATARVLSDHFDRVTVLERDDLADGTSPRRGVPQGRHVHALQAGGARALAAMFPGLMDELVRRGAAHVEFNRGRWYEAGGYRTRSLIERRVVSASRPFLENAIRERVEALPNVSIERGAAVETLLAGGGCVTGVRAFDGSVSYPLEADLVVDCSGRSSRGGLWMEDLGYAAPRVDEVECRMRYATVVLPRRRGDLDADFAVVLERPPQGNRAAFLMPVEGDRWIATIGAGHGAAAPTDEVSFRQAAALLPAPELHELLQGMGDLGPVATHRLPSSKRRRYEKLRRVPAGFVVLGDAICSFNPIYGQGMSSAVLQAVQLGECLAAGHDDAALVRAFYQRAAKVIAPSWQLAIAADRAYSGGDGSAPLRAELVNRYLHQVLTAAHVSPEVNTAMLLVQSLVAPPAILFRPEMVRSVRAACRQAKRQPAARVTVD